MQDKVADVVPIGAPRRGELWRRLRLAESLLRHREPSEETTAAVLDVLTGRTPADGSVQRGA